MSHRHYYDVDDAEPKKCTELTPYLCVRAWQRGTDDPEASYFVGHDCPEPLYADHRCDGRVDVVPLKRPDGTEGPAWDRAPGTSLAQGNLTLTPSIETVDHKHPGGHGYITAGKWGEA